MIDRMKAVRYAVAACAVIAVFSCVVFSSGTEDPRIEQQGWPFVWGLAHSSKMSPPTFLWGRLLPQHLRPFPLVADAVVGALIGAAVGGIIGLSIREPV